MNVPVVLSDPPYGAERSFNGLRLALSLSRSDDIGLQMFRLAGAVACAVTGQQLPQGYYNHQTTNEIDAGHRTLALASGERIAYDVLLGVPPHQAPAIARDSGLAGQTGFLLVDKQTLQTHTEGVFAVGDVTAIQIGGGKFLPKAGVFAHAEAEVVSQRIAVYAAGEFYAEGGPLIRLRKPCRIWHLGKTAFEQYWLRRWS